MFLVNKLLVWKGSFKTFYSPSLAFSFFWGGGGHQSQFTNCSLGQVSPGSVRAWVHNKISRLGDALTSSGSLSAYDLPILTTHLGAGRGPRPWCFDI